MSGTMKQMVERLTAGDKRVTMAVNRLLGRTRIPNPREHLYVEPTNVCNLKCRFCPHSKQRLGHGSAMDYAFFVDVIDQATDLGYDAFGLTPLTGEPLCDRQFAAKLAYLEAHPKVADYRFFTNFTQADETVVRRLVAARKLCRLSISLYGHDRDSFLTLTQSNEATYERLVTNLRLLRENMGGHVFRLQIFWRTYSSVTPRDFEFSELGSVVQDLRQAFELRLTVPHLYGTWGDRLGPNDMPGLDIDFYEGAKRVKNGACTMMFCKNVVLADGRVNAGMCGETMVIGDLKTQSLRDIYSVRNEALLKLIQDQQYGRFSPTCLACDTYRSIYDYSRAYYPSHRKRPVTLNEFYAELSG